MQGERLVKMTDHPRIFVQHNFYNSKINMKNKNSIKSILQTIKRGHTLVPRNLDLTRFGDKANKVSLLLDWVYPDLGEDDARVRATVQWEKQSERRIANLDEKHYDSILFILITNILNDLFVL